MNNLDSQLKLYITEHHAGFAMRLAQIRLEDDEFNEIPSAEFNVFIKVLKFKFYMVFTPDIINIKYIILYPGIAGFG